MKNTGHISKALSGLLLLFISFTAKSQSSSSPDNNLPIFAQHGPNDTIICSAVVYEGDTIEAKILAGVYVWAKGNPAAREQWNRLRNAVYVTYPYARKGRFCF